MCPSVSSWQPGNLHQRRDDRSLFRKEAVIKLYRCDDVVNLRRRHNSSRSRMPVVIDKEIVVKVSRCDDNITAHRRPRFDPSMLKQLVIRLTRCDDVNQGQKPVVADYGLTNVTAPSDINLGSRKHDLQEIEQQDAGLKGEDEPPQKRFCSIAPIVKEIEDETKLEVLASAMELDTEVNSRFDCYLNSGLDFKTVRSLMQLFAEKPVDATCVWAVCDLVKGYVEDIMDAALQYQQHWEESGPVSPEAIMAATLQLQIEENVRNTAAESGTATKEILESGTATAETPYLIGTTTADAEAAAAVAIQ